MWSTVSAVASFPCEKQQEGVLEEIRLLDSVSLVHIQQLTGASQAVLRIQ